MLTAFAKRKGFYRKFLSSGISWLVIILIIGFYWHKFSKSELFNLSLIIRNDVISYYNYLPAALVYNDLTFSNPKMLDWNITLPDGSKVNKTTMGVAYFYAPFFIPVYEFFKYHNYNINVYSPMFQFAIGLSALFAALLAMIVMRSNLRRFFSDIITGLCLIIIFLGTNAFHYTIYEGAYSHIYSLFLISLLVNLTFTWYEKPSILISILLGLIAGWVVLVRPVNIIFCLFPLLYFTVSFKTTLAFWQKHWLKIVLTLAFAFIIWIPQLLYWKYATGHYLFYSYGSETFNWGHPKIYRGIFSYHNGWLVYTPLMTLSLLGFVFLFRRHRVLFYPIIVIFLLNIYIVYSWWCWWYSGFGSRAMVDSYAIMVFPVGALLAWMGGLKKIVWPVAVLVISFFLYLNIFQSWQKLKGLIHWDGMTKELYWAHFLKESFHKDCDKMVEPPE